MSADPDFRAWIKAEKPTQVQVINRLIGCTIDNLEGNLITEGSLSAARKSVVEFGWVVGLPETVASDEYFHVKYVPDRREKPTDKDGREGNLGQAIFHRPTNSGVYAIVSNFEVSRIGYNDISQTYVDDVDRKAQYAALVESILYTFVEMNGAMRNTQMPHLVALDGVVSVSYGVAPAPTVSPLNEDFQKEIEGTKDAINRLHDKEIVQVLPFNTITEFSDILSNLVVETDPFTMQSAETI
jgi:CRISPR-associated protein Cst2